MLQKVSMKGQMTVSIGGVKQLEGIVTLDDLLSADCKYIHPFIGWHIYANDKIKYIVEQSGNKFKIVYKVERQNH